MRKIILATAVTLIATPLAAQTAPEMTTDLTVTLSPQEYRICNDRPARPTWMDAVHPREAYKALTLMALYGLRSSEAIVASGDCGCDVRFPAFATISQAEQTQAQLALREQQNRIAREVQDLCDAQGDGS
jgi:hypothetical protein